MYSGGLNIINIAITLQENDYIGNYALIPNVLALASKRGFFLVLMVVVVNSATSTLQVDTRSSGGGAPHHHHHCHCPPPAFLPQSTPWAVARGVGCGWHVVGCAHSQSTLRAVAHRRGVCVWVSARCFVLPAFLVYEIRWLYMRWWRSGHQEALTLRAPPFTGLPLLLYCHLYHFSISYPLRWPDIPFAWGGGGLDVRGWA